MPSGPPWLTPDLKIIGLGLLTALLTTTGTVFQKINGIRGGNAVMSVWLVLATLSFFPTFVITNKAFLMSGKMSLYVPMTAASYVLSMIVGRFFFGEVVSVERWIGCAFVLVGIGIIVRG